MVTVMPLMVGGAEEYLGWDRKVLGWLASGEMMGIAGASLFLFIFQNRISLRQVATIGLIGMLTCNLICISLPPYYLMIPLRIVAGLFGGLAYTGAITFLARLPNAQIGYSNYIITFSFFSGVYLFIFPWLLSHLGYYFGYVVLSVQVALAILFIPFAMGRSEKSKVQNLKKEVFIANLTPVILSVLILFLFFQMGNSGLFAFAERLGNEYQIKSGMIGIALSLSILIGIPTGWFNIYMARHMTAAQMVRLGLLIMLLALGFLWNGANWSFNFIIGIITLEAGFSMVLPNVFSWLASFDASGRWVLLGTILNWSGQGVGPLLAAFMVGGGSYQRILIWPAFFFIFGLGLTYLSLKRKRLVKNY